MPYSFTPTIGVDVNNVIPQQLSQVTGSNQQSSILTGGGASVTYQYPFQLGHEVWGNDGKRYVLVKNAAATFTAPVTVLTLTNTPGSGNNSTTTTISSVTGGSYSFTGLNAAGGNATVNLGDLCWVSATSV